jgi:hypothetical protein
MCAALLLGASCAGDSPLVEICGNGLDDDGDGVADCQDSDCAAQAACQLPVEICDNLLDDDGNGATDCDDAACAAEPSCAAMDEICDNHLDDDGNGATDCDDAACAAEPSCALPDEICDNHLDDDGNGATDCDDAACAAEPLCEPPPTELCDNGLDDDGNGATDCDDTACAGIDPCIELASPGDVVIVEIMIDPVSVADAAGEWIELRNTTGGDIDIAGWVLHDIDANSPQWHIIDAHGPVVIAAGGTLVLGALADPATNGGVPVDYQWATFDLANDADEVVLEVKGEQIDTVAYVAPPWPVAAGHSLSLDPAAQTASANDDPQAWCAGASAYNGADYGSPGAANPSCP